MITRNQGEIRVSAPLFIPATKDSALAKVMKEEVALLGKVIGWRYKVVERSGKMLRDMLVRTSMFRGIHVEGLGVELVNVRRSH